ncbi:MULTISPECIES: LexA family protein [Latilactobacillus]|uniref:LexA family protein n=1 Tax=Latilactobacillus TaxID=2767885 RepID=UPI000DAAE63F|nr:MULTISPECIES: LexA family transcriptional regulator [Latilactobacillus]AWV72523.1 XRE family transcriptional regulator [Latilactobacillus curvatus]AYG16496.1 helix-turn-helix domain-containing protein [Latilactobacillus sakei]AYG25217.1 helix-turn-helix domain-containing protein [Latilactobacillus sakei]AYG30405.1 helix-turn-helix domain-containing protein [Latilactobacillus sakei]AYG32136.1 helix-turn-helix domain-containing protein [Latilactobacillus sakei]
MRSNDGIMNILIEARKRKGISINELASLTGVAKSSISRYENRSRQFPLDQIDTFSKALGLDPKEVLGFNDDSNISLVKSIIRIPIIGEIACGDPITAQENISGYVEESTENLPSGELFYLKAKGSSMEPTVPNGSNVLIREQPEVEDGEIAAVLVNGDTEATLKRVKHQGNIIILIPDNQEYNPYIITADNPAKILGKAIRFTTDL